MTKKLTILVTFHFIHQKLSKSGIHLCLCLLQEFSRRGGKKIKVIIKFAFRQKVEHLKRPAVQSNSQQRSAAIFPGRLLKQQSHKRASFWLRWCRLRVPPSIHRFFSRPESSINLFDISCNSIFQSECAHNTYFFDRASSEASDL